MFSGDKNNTGDNFHEMIYWKALNWKGDTLNDIKTLESASVINSRGNKGKQLTGCCNCHLASNKKGKTAYTSRELS